jgi:hypothetical protein
MEYSVAEMILIDYEFNELYSSAGKIIRVVNKYCSSDDIENIYKMNCKILKKYIKNTFDINEKEFISNVYNDIRNDPDYNLREDYDCKHTAYKFAFYRLRDRFWNENCEFGFSWIT